MPLTFLAGYDGSAAARAALRFVRGLGERFGARVVAVHVYGEVPFVAGKGASEGARRELEDSARADAERLLAEGAGAGVETLAIPALSPARGLQRAAEEQHASLLAVGASHRGPIGRLIPGGLADRLLDGAPCPVGVVPDGAGDRVATVAVAYDASDEARAALRAAQAVAERMGARLLLLAAIDPEAVPAIALVGAAVDVDARLREILGRRLAEAAESLPPELDAEAQLVTGVGAPAIVAACRAMGVDVLVSGSRGYGPVRSVVLGSFSRYLVDHAPCPVVVVPRGAGVQLDHPPAEMAATSA